MDANVKHQHDYDDIKEIGTLNFSVLPDGDPQARMKVASYHDGKKGDLLITYRGFTFDPALSERDQRLKILAWARDVLDAALSAERVGPDVRIVAIDEAPVSHLRYRR